MDIFYVLVGSIVVSVLSHLLFKKKSPGISAVFFGAIYASEKELSVFWFGLVGLLGWVLYLFAYSYLKRYIKQRRGIRR